MSNNNEYQVIGLMSGTSLDGVDIAYCRFWKADNQWNFELNCSETIPYTSRWVHILSSLEKSSALTFQQIHTEYGFYLGNLSKQFIKKHGISPDFVASHGHTIYHSDFKTHILTDDTGASINKKITVQIGCGGAIAATCGLPTICDFRTTDVALGGQGAPLVPICDKLLFKEYDFCLNLGGFANISYEHNNERIAYDICPVNIVMNALCLTIGKNYDNKGRIASGGNVNEKLLDTLNALPFYHLPADTPKSLGKEWVIQNINPILETYHLTSEDALRTFAEHISIQIANVLHQKSLGKLFITGGGAFNTFLIERIQNRISHQVVIPTRKTIEFKEALAFAFLGVLRMRNEINCLKSVTGASKNSVSGAIYL